MSIFKDFIPEGENTGAQGNGFVDFVPAKGEFTTPKPVTDADVEKWSDAKPVVDVKVKEVKPVVKKTKKSK